MCKEIYHCAELPKYYGISLLHSFSFCVYSLAIHWIFSLLCVSVCLMKSVLVYLLFEYGTRGVLKSLGLRAGYAKVSLNSVFSFKYNVWVGRVYFPSSNWKSMNVSVRESWVCVFLMSFALSSRNRNSIKVCLFTVNITIFRRFR